MSFLSQHATAGLCAVPIAYFIWRLSGKYLMDYFTRKSTILYELEQIGKAREEDKRIKGTVIICGGR